MGFFLAGFRIWDSKEKMWTLVKEKVKLKSKFHFWSLFLAVRRERERVFYVYSEESKCEKLWAGLKYFPRLVKFLCVI